MKKFTIFLAIIAIGLFSFEVYYFTGALNSKSNVSTDGQVVGTLVSVSSSSVDVLEKKREGTFVQDEKGYDYIRDITNIDDKLAYVVFEGKEPFIIYDGKEIAKGYNNVQYLSSINNKLAYAVASSGEHYIIYDQQEFGRYGQGTPRPVEVNNKLAFEFAKNNKSYIVYDGEEIGKQYDSAKIPFELNNKLGYIVRVADTGKSYIVYDGQEIGKQYDHIASARELNGKLFYTADKGGKFVNVYDGNEVDANSQFFKSQGEPIVYSTEGKKTFLIYKGMKLGQEYQIISDAAIVAGKLVFAGFKSGKFYLVREQ